MEAPKLKPCPFCGGAATWAYGSRGWKVECEGRFETCAINARTHYQPAKHLAVAAWNNRADLIGKDVLREALAVIEDAERAIADVAGASAALPYVVLRNKIRALIEKDKT